jgi:hypothetical protein
MEMPVVVYSHRARPISAPVDHALTGKGLAMRQDTKEIVLPYADIRRITLMYKPRNTTNEGYTMTVRGPKRLSATVSNLSWKSLVEFDRQDAAYIRFVTALVERAAAANPKVELVTGIPRYRHVLAIGAAALAISAMGAVVIAALLGESRNWPLALFAAALGGYCAWWATRFLSRNAPGTFRPGAIPAKVLPQPAAAGAAGESIKTAL